MNLFVFRFDNLIIKFGLLFFTFFVGVASTLLSPEKLLTSIVVHNSPPKVTLCQLTQSPENYHGKLVRIKADIEDFDGELFIEDKSCQSPTATVAIRLIQSYELQEKQLRKHFAQANFKNPQVSVLVTGNFDADAKVSCFGWKFAIQTTSVELQQMTERT